MDFILILSCGADLWFPVSARFSKLFGNPFPCHSNESWLYSPDLCTSMSTALSPTMSSSDLGV